MTTPTPAEVPEPDRLTRFEAAAHRQRLLTIALTPCLLVTSTGWWFTAADNAATVRNGKVADCRAEALAVDLDGFRVIVSAGSTPAEEAAAADRLEEAGPLTARYAACAHDNGGTP